MPSGLQFSSTDPAAPTGFTNVTFVTDMTNPTFPSLSAYTPSLEDAIVQTIPGINNGWSVSSQLALTNTVVMVKASAGNFGGYMLLNPDTATSYIQLFDTAQPVVLGTTLPLFVIPLPGGAAANVEWALGITHINSIQAAATTSPTGAGAPNISLIGFFLYK